jgi:S-ribosylhomocysteine lyase
MEHLGATWLRNNPEWQDKVLYFGPMGCRTGFYLLLAGEYASRDILPLMDGMFRFIAAYEGDIPGASAKDCGNYLDLNLSMAKYYAEKYIREVLDQPAEEKLIYPA